jgi:hypothetical protein
MTDNDARVVANTVLVAAGATLGYLMVTRPPLRRLALRVVKVWLGASVPMYLANEAHHAWVESGRRRLT